MYGPADLDEGNYATIGMMILRGSVLYKEIPASKPPLIYYINTLISWIFGSNLLVLRLIFNAVIGMTSVFVFFTARKVYGNKTAVISAYLFAIFSASAVWGFHSPTNVYSSLAESVAAYFLIKALFAEKRGEGELRHVVVAGVFIGLSTLIRQTGFLFFVAVLLWYLMRFSRIKPFSLSAMLKQTSRRVMWIALGIIMAVLPMIVYFALMSALDDLFYWILLEPIPGMAKHSPWTLNLKAQWLVVVALAMALLLYFTITTVKNDLLHKFEEMLLLVLWLMIPFSFIVLGPVPSYPHYYYQILPPLCMMAGKGLTYFHQNWRQRNAVTKRKSLKEYMPTLNELITVTLIILSLTVNLLSAQVYVSRRDSRVAMEVADFMKSHTAPNEKIFVFETLWAKIGPLIYYLSERSPPLPRPFFFTYTPLGVTNLDVENVEKALSEQDVKYVVVIGSPRPPDWNSTKILLTILSNYYPFYVVWRNYVPYPWLPPCDVVVYKRVDLWSEDIKSVDVETRLIIDYDFASQGRWITAVRPVNPEWMNLTNAALSFWVFANEDNNTLYIDLFDAQGDFREFGLFLNFKGWKHVIVPISDTFFPKRHRDSPDFDEIEKLHFVLEQTVSGSSSGLVLINIIQILYVEGNSDGG